LDAVAWKPDHGYLCLDLDVWRHMETWKPGNLFTNNQVAPFDAYYCRISFSLAALSFAS